MQRRLTGSLNFPLADTVSPCHLVNASPTFAEGADYTSLLLALVIVGSFIMFSLCRSAAAVEDLF